MCAKVITHNKKLKQWVDKAAVLCQPDEIVWIDGSIEQKQKLEKEAMSSGELIPLNEEKLPGCFLRVKSI